MIQRFFMLAPLPASRRSHWTCSWPASGSLTRGPLSPALVSTRIESLPEERLSLVPTLRNPTGLAEEIGRARKRSLAWPMTQTSGWGATSGPTHPRIERLRDWSAARGALRLLDPDHRAPFVGVRSRYLALAPTLGNRESTHHAA